MREAEFLQPQRVAYIDALKGVACVLILVIHAVVARIEALPVIDKAVLTLIFASTTLFFFASGMNVVNFIRRYGKQPGFKIMRFYLIAAVLLFVLSICFSINRGSMHLPQIFQGIAMCTALTFLCLRMRLPNWALAILAFILYGLWLLFWQQHAAALAVMRPLPLAGEKRAFDEWLKTVPPLFRFLYVHFSLLPWVSSTLLGAATYRSVVNSPNKAIYWAIFYCLMPILGFFSRPALGLEQPLLLTSYADMMLRNSPFLFCLWLGVVGLATLAMMHWYVSGNGTFASFLEFVGRESFLFLIWHWLFLSLFLAFTQILVRQIPIFGGRFAAYLPVVLAGAIVFPTLPWAARLGKRWRRQPYFIGQAFVCLVIFSLPGLLAFLRTNTLPLGRMLLSFPACLAFAYLYPELRARLRRRCMMPTGD